MVDKIIILGNSIAAHIIYGILARDKSIEVVAFAVSARYIKEQEMFGKPVHAIENLVESYAPGSLKFINATGYKNLNQNRELLFRKVKELGYDFVTYIHQNATILTDDIGEGVFIMPGVVIEPYAVIGNNTVIWSNSVIAHHASISENCWIASGCVVAGQSVIGRNTFLGVNSTVVNNIVVGDYNLIGAGALISKNTSPQDVFLARSGEKHRFDSHNYVTFYGF